MPAMNDERRLALRRPASKHQVVKSSEVSHPLAGDDLVPRLVERAVVLDDVLEGPKRQKAGSPWVLAAMSGTQIGSVAKRSESDSILIAKAWVTYLRAKHSSPA
jgi:hypothetical protein